MKIPSTGYGQIRVQGDDAAAFLNAQLTRRVDDLEERETRLAAWCNARGRVQALFRIAVAKDGFSLQLPSSLVPVTLPRLQMFVLRSRVRLDPVENSPQPKPSRLTEIRAGIPEIYPETREQFLPQMLNLDTLGAIDFKKGCYPGQEIVARSQYRGQVKRRMYLFGATGGNLPTPGTEVSTSEGHSGTVVDAVAEKNNQVLIQAVIPVEAREQLWHMASNLPLKLL